MINHIDHIVEHLFHKKSLNDVSEFELERFTATYPYFAAGHFLLAKKTQISQPEKNSEKIATTSLYYHNALWLQWLINQDPDGGGKNQEIEPGVITAIHDDHGLTESETSTITEESEESAEPENESLQAISPGHEIISEVTTEFEGDSQRAVNFSTTTDEAPIIDEEAYEFREAPIDAGQNQEVEKENYEPFQQLEEGTTVPGDVNNRGSQDISAEISTQGQQTESIDHASSTDENKSIDSRFEYGNEEVLPLQDDEIEHDQENQISTEESRATAASIERTLSSAGLIPTKAAIEKNEFTFEPYHTIDYFASQNIKLQQSDLSKDKFGKQLKSFTEWLRSMKRLPQPAIDGNMDEATQASIQNIAEHSFEEKDIVTETMAEVWIKQGNKAKAIDTLEKLSLINPSKSHYFAAKIEQLKAS